MAKQILIGKHDGVFKARVTRINNQDVLTSTNLSHFAVHESFPSPGAFMKGSITLAAGEGQRFISFPDQGYVPYMRFQSSTNRGDATPTYLYPLTDPSILKVSQNALIAGPNPFSDRPVYLYYWLYTMSNNGQ